MNLIISKFYKFRRLKGLYKKVVKMDAIFLNPPFLPKFSRYSRSPCITRGGTLYYPLMECIAAAYADSKGFETKVIDSVADDISKK